MTGRRAHPPAGPTPRRGRVGAIVRAGAWIAALVIVIVATTAAGTGGLAAPPVASGARALSDWLSARDAPVAAMAIMRVLVLAMAWYLLGTTVASMALRVVRATTAVRALDALTLPAVRRLVTSAVGVSVAASALAGSGGLTLDGVAGAREPVIAATMRRLDSPTDVVMHRLPSDDDPPLMHRLGDDAGGAGAAAAAPAAPPATSPADSAPTNDHANTAGATWTVMPGDSLWRIAERTLAAAWGREPSEHEVDPYWRGLVDRNRHALADPHNADLVFPGQVFELPPPPPPSG